MAIKLPDGEPVAAEPGPEGEEEEPPRVDAEKMLFKARDGERITSVSAEKRDLSCGAGGPTGSKAGRGGGGSGHEGGGAGAVRRADATVAIAASRRSD